MARTSAAIRTTGTLGGVRFTEVMQGYIHVGDDIADFDVAERKARGAASAAQLYLSVDAYSVDNRTCCLFCTTLRARADWDPL
jgi:hypothetical protein